MRVHRLSTGFQGACAVLHAALLCGAAPSSAAEFRPTPVCEAIIAGEFTKAEQLLGAGADPNAGYGCALIAAASRGHLTLTGLLLDRGANANMTSTRSRIYAFTGQKMVQVPPDELQPDRIDETARRLKCTLRGPHSLLHEATDPGAPGGDGRDGVAMLLVDRGADPRIRDLNGATPLMNAARRNSARVVRRLLDAGAEPSVKDRCDRTAGDHARSDEIRNLLGTRPAN